MRPTLPAATPAPLLQAGVARAPYSAPPTAERGRPAASATPTLPAAAAQRADVRLANRRTVDALAGPPRAAPQRPAFAAVCADIAAQAQADALIDAEDALAELQGRLRDLRAMRPATAALLFGSDAAWRGALARVGVAAGRQTGAVERLRSACRATPDFALHEIARPLGPATRVQWTGD